MTTNIDRALVLHSLLVEKTQQVSDWQREHWELIRDMTTEEYEDYLARRRSKIGGLTPAPTCGTIVPEVVPQTQNHSECPAESWE